MVVSKPEKLPDIASASQADDQALSDAIAEETAVLRRHAISLLYNGADAEDLVQDCLEAALNKQASLRDRSRLRPWLFSILNNLFLMRLRVGKHRGIALP